MVVVFVCGPIKPHVPYGITILILSYFSEIRRLINMESFLKLVLDKEILHPLEKVSEDGDGSLELSFIKFLQNIIFKRDVMVEFEEILNSACSSELFTVKNDVIKRLIVALNSFLLSDINSKCKIDVFRCTFQAFILSCKENERLPALQFFVVLAHLLGLDNTSNENVDDDCIVDYKNFKHAFGIDISKPSKVSYSILKELLVCFSKQSLIINSSTKSMYDKWLQKLIQKVANIQPFQRSFLEIFLICIDIDFKLVEKNLEHIMRGVLSQRPPIDEDFSKSYETFLECSLKMSAKLQRTAKFVKNFLLGIKTTATILDEEVILPLTFMKEFSKTVLLASTQQSLQLLDNLVPDLAECYTAALANSSGFQSLAIVSNLVIAFLKNLKIFAPNISSNTLKMLTDKLASLIEILKKFGKDIFSNKDLIVKSENIILSHLELCLYCGEVQALIDCYKDSILTPSELENSTTEKDWLCCLSLKQWNSIVKFVLKVNLELCYPVCFQLAVHKLRTLKLNRTTFAEESVLKFILSQFELKLDTFNIFREVSPEDVTLIISFLTPDQAKVVSAKIFHQILKAENIEWKSWLSDSNVQENLTIIVNLFSESLKKTGSVLESSKLHSKFSWLLDDYFVGGNAVNGESLKHLHVKINNLLRRWRKVSETLDKNSKEEKEIIRVFEMFKLLPVNHLTQDYRQLGLSFAVAVAIILSYEESAVCLAFESVCCFLASDADASTIFDVGLCMKWLCELTLEKKEANDLKLKIIEGLVRGCPKMKFGLSQLGGMIDVAEKIRQECPLKMLETRVILYQELGKCWQRAKKRQADNDVIGTFRTKLARVICNEAKELENSEINLDNCKLFFRIFSIELLKAMKSNEEDVSALMEQKFPSYFDFAIESLSKAYDDPSASFLTFILSSSPQLKKFLPADSNLKIWRALLHYEKGNWRIFCSNCDDDEFNLILSDLLQRSEKFFTSEPDQHLTNCFEIWSSFFEFSSQSKRQACQFLLRDLFRFTHDCDLLLKDLPIKKRIHLIKFYSYCVSSEKVVLTSHILDTIIHVMVEVLDDSSPIEDFRDLFLVEVNAAVAILLRQFLWTKSKVHLSFVLFKRMLGSLTKRCDVTRQVNSDEIIMLTTCAFELEKWVKLMVKKKKDFARTVAYFIATVISAIASTTVSPAIKFHFINCINHFLSISDSHTTAYLMRVLKPGYQQVFNSIYNRFKKYHKYTGKI